MSYKVLYRKYRPDSFDNLIGQESIKRILKNSIINNSISHAYIFSGPRGTGKTSTARILAKTINCLDNTSGIPCNKCDNCKNFDTNPDIIEIDAASNNGVDEIRELINNVKLMPTSSKYKVYIIDEVHMLSQSAFNALLLTLEEPPSHVVFILATTNIESVPITILSRCQKYEFVKINDDMLVDLLKNICEKEKIKYTIEGLKEIASLSDGGARDALSILDQLSKEKKEINEELVAKEIGSISFKFLNDLFEYTDNNDKEKAIEIINNLKSANINYKVVIKKFIELLANKAIEVLNENKYRLTYRQIKQLIIELNDCLNSININVDPYTIIKIILLGYVNNEYTITEKTTKKVEEKIEKKDNIIQEENIENAAKSRQNISENNIEIRINNCFVNASKENLENIKNKWNNFIKKSSNKIKGIIIDSNIVAASDKYAIITAVSEHNVEEINYNIEKIEQEFNNDKLNYKFVAITDDNWQIKKQEYIKNLKSGKKYEIKEEQNNNPEEKKDDIMEEIAGKLFAKEKIEIEGE